MCQKEEKRKGPITKKALQGKKKKSPRFQGAPLEIEEAGKKKEDQFRRGKGKFQCLRI